MIELDNTLDAWPVNFTEINFVQDINDNRMQAKIFSNKPVLLTELLFAGTKKEFLCHSKFQFVDATTYLRIYYTDGRAFFDQRYIYHFHDGTVDKIRMNNRCN